MTGGSEGRHIAGLIEMFNDPLAFSILPMRHSFTENGEPILSGYFIPSWQTVMHCMDSRGVAISEKAKQYYLDAREDMKGEALRKYCSETAFTVEEALSMEGENQFNQAKLADQYSRLIIHQDKSCPKVQKGSLSAIYGTGNHVIGARWSANGKGLVEIIEHPILGEDSRPIPNLYVAGIDSIDQGEKDSVTSNGSKFCIVIKKRTFGNAGDVYVAKYLHRPNDIREAYGTAMLMLLYYNCKANLEDTKTNIKSYLMQHKHMDLLMARPRAAVSDMGESRRRSRKGATNLIGTPGSTKMIVHGLGLVADYVEDFSENLYFPDMLQQLQKYSYEAKTKFDIIAAMQMAEIGDEDMFNKKVQSGNGVSRPSKVGYYIDPITKVRRFGKIPSSTNGLMGHKIGKVNPYNNE